MTAREQLRAPVVGLLAVATVGAVGVAQRAPAGRGGGPAPTRVPVDRTTVVCPDLSGGGPRTATMTVADVRPALPASGSAGASVSYVALAPDRAGAGRRVRLLPRPESVVTATAAGSAVRVTATGRDAATVAVDEHDLVAWGRHRSLRSTSCLAPATDWWVTGADGRVGYDDYLFLANPGPDLANVTVTAWSDKGAFTPPRLDSYPLRPGSAAWLPVAHYAPDTGLVSVHVHANTGRVVAEAVDERHAGLAPAGADWIPPTRPPATRLVVPGFPGGPGYRDLVVSVPGAADANVSLRVSTPSASYVPAGYRSLHVAARHSGVVDLERAFARRPGAVVVTSDVPVVAAAVSQEPVRGRLPDVQWQPAAAPLRGPSVLPSNVAPFGQTAQLILTAPDRAATVRVSSPFGSATTLAVPAGRTLAVLVSDVFSSSRAAAGPLVLSPVDGGPVYASRTLFASGTHGNLVTAQQPTALPGAVVLPPAVADLRAAVR